MTKFIVLAQEGDNAWFESGHEEAHNRSEAVKKAYLRSPQPKVTDMVAVPQRSWSPQKIRTETVTKVVLGDETIKSGENLPLKEEKP